MLVVRVENLSKRFNLEAGLFARFGKFVHAVNDVSFEIEQGEIYGLVGESGCGKTTTARLLVRMYEADSGAVFYKGSENIAEMKRRAIKNYREKVKYIFQDPARSLNPRMSVEQALLSGYKSSSAYPSGAGALKKARKEAAAILEETGLSASDLERRPSEFSGGQRQRISIARGLILKPELLICDEIVSALDVSIQGQILNLLQDIRSKRPLSMLFIAHNLKVSCYFCDRIAVMYRGEIVEEHSAAGFYKTCLHPYTKTLFAAALASEAPAPSATTPLQPHAGGASQGCSFAERCSLREARCTTGHPELSPIDAPPGGKPHKIRCWRF